MTEEEMEARIDELTDQLAEADEKLRLAESKADEYQSAFDDIEQIARKHS